MTKSKISSILWYRQEQALRSTYNQTERQVERKAEAQIKRPVKTQVWWSVCSGLWLGFGDQYD